MNDKSSEKYGYIAIYDIVTECMEKVGAKDTISLRGKRWRRFLAELTEKSGVTLDESDCGRARKLEAGELSCFVMRAVRTRESLRCLAAGQFVRNNGAFANFSDNVALR